MSACGHAPICTETFDSSPHGDTKWWVWRCEFTDCDWSTMTTKPELRLVTLTPFDPFQRVDVTANPFGDIFERRFIAGKEDQ